MSRSRRKRVETKVAEENIDKRSQVILDLLMTGAKVNIEERLAEMAEEVKGALLAEVEQLESRMERAKNITVTTERGTTDVKGLTHVMFPRLLSALETRLPIMMVGTAGSGKTFSVEQAAEALSLPFYAQSVGSQTSKSDLLGYMHANGGYVDTAFRRAYENGGVFLMDEIDAGNSNVLIILNSALSGSWCSFPDKMVERHKDFYFIGTANTFGLGASRTYAGRNQLDAATLDRFVVLEWNVDESLEAALVSNIEHGSKWHTVVKAVRKSVEERGYRVIVSPRATLKGALMLNSFSLMTVISSTLLAGVTKDEFDVLKQVALDAWE